MAYCKEMFSRRKFIYLSTSAGLGLASLSMTGCTAPEEVPPEQVAVNADTPVSLPTPATEGKMSLEAAIAGRRSERRFKRAALHMEQLSQLLWAAQGITDPHPNPARRFRRAAPSAGAQYPLDIYVVAGVISGLETGIYHYQPHEHILNLLATGDLRQPLAEACLGQMLIASAPAVIVITAEYDRITDRYGKRGLRYTHMEVGHVGQNLHLQAETLGLGTVIIGAFRDTEVSTVLQLPRKHEPLYVMPVGYVK